MSMTRMWQNFLNRLQGQKRRVPGHGRRVVQKSSRPVPEQLEERIVLDSTQPWTQPLNVMAPHGSQTYLTEATSSSLTVAPETDTYTLALEANQRLSVLFRTDAANLLARVQLLDPDQNVIATADASAVGQDLVLQAVALPSAGSYSIQVQNLAGSGDYSLRLTNAVVEQEFVSGVTNQTLATAQNLDAYSVALPGGGDRLAVYGGRDIYDGVDGTYDTYSVTLTAGTYVSVALGSNYWNQSLTLLDAAGTVVAEGGSTDDSPSAISSYLVSETGTYYVRLGTGYSDPYQIIVTRNVELELEDNDYSGGAQRLYTGHGIGHLSYSFPHYDYEDWYAVYAAEGDTLVIATETPHSLAGDPQSTLNPAVYLYDSSVSWVHYDSNSAVDGINANLSYTVPEGAAGVYYIAVYAESGFGAYTVSVTGASETQSAPLDVIDAYPGGGETWTNHPGYFYLTFGDDIDRLSVSMSDLVVNGQPNLATYAQVYSTRTIEFGIPESIEEDGEFTFTIPAGAIRSLAGTTNTEISVTFTVDSEGPRVITSSLNAGAVLAAGNHSFEFQFNEPIYQYVDSSDWALRNAQGTIIPSSSYDYDVDTYTLTVDYQNLVPGEYSFELISGYYNIRDEIGNSLDGAANGFAQNYSRSFTIDVGNQPLTPLTRLAPSGSLLHYGVQAGNIHDILDVDEFTLELQGGQTLALALTVAPSLAGTIQVYAPGGALLGSASSSQGGRTAHLPSITAATTGTYTFRVSSDGGAGAFSLLTLLNGQFEVETLTGATNDSLVTAESLLPSLMNLPGGANRLAATGVVSDVADYFSFTLTAGQGMTLAAMNLTGAGGNLRLELLDSAGQLLALGGNNESGTGVAIQNFTALQTGTYFARVVSTTPTATSYSLVVTRGATFDWEPNSELGQAQLLGSTGVALGSVGANGAGGTDTPGALTGLTTNLFDVAGFRWDIGNYGSIGDGTNDAYDGGMVLAGFGYFSQGRFEANNREIAIGPSLSGAVSITRKIYVPEDGNFARYLDSLTNTGATTVNYTFTINTNLGSDGNEPFVSTSSGDGVFTIDDNWIVTDDSAGGGDPAVGHIIAGSNGQLRPASATKGSGEVSYQFVVTLAPGETKSILHFATQNYDRATAVNTASLLETLPGEALEFLSDLELSQVVNFAVETVDQYLFDAVAGSNLVISTSTPTEGSTANSLDPLIELYDPSGVLVASDNNGAVDGRNALLNYTIPAGQGGTYRVVVNGVASAGAYVLQVSGASTTQLPLQATAVNPVDDAFLTVFPTTYRLTFNQELLLSSLQASDLRVNGTPVSSYTIIDGRTLDLSLAGLNTGDGVYTVTISPGALASLGGTVNEFFSASFDVDATNPTVVTSSIHPGDTVNSGSLTYQVQFSEPLDTNGLTSEDVTLVNSSTTLGYLPQSFAYDAESRTLTLTFENLEEGTYGLTLISAGTGFRDLRGNLLDGTPSFPLPSGDGGTTGNFLVNFNVDTGTRAFTTPLTSSTPLGTLIYTGSMSGYITPTADTDTYTLAIEAGQMISVIVNPGGTALPADAFLPIVDLVDSTGTVLATGTAAAAGQPARIVAHNLPTGGNYRIVVRGDGLTTGSYSVQVFLNMVLETEITTGASNNTLVTAQDLGPALMTLTDGVSRQVVNGSSRLDDDFYRITATPGEYVSVVAARRTGALAHLELQDESGTTLAIGSYDESSNQLRIDNFLASGGAYYILVRGAANGSFASAYNLAVLRGANLDREPNDDVNSPQVLEGPLRALGSVQGNSNFVADFNDAAGMLSLDGFTATGLWHVTDQAGGSLPGHTSPYMAYFGNDASQNFDYGSVSGTLTSPPLSLRADVAAQLSLKYRLQTETGTSWDRAEVRVSTNNGESYTTIATKATHFFQNLSWTSTTIDLSAYAGQTILLQFSFNSGDGVSNTGLGWQIDDLEVTGVTDQQDHYSFNANAGDALVLSTTTPGSAPGEPANPFDVILDLYDPLGNLVATDNNSAVDGHNALLNYTAVLAGAYTVRVRGTNGGAYQLTVNGSTANNLRQPEIVAVTPENGSPLAEAPDSLTLIFSESIRSDSIQLSDLIFSTPGVTVTGVTQIDGHTLRFDLSIPDASGLYEYSLAAGAVQDLQGQGNVAFAGSLFVDRLGPMVTSTNPAFQASAPFTEVTFTFNEAVDRDTVSTADVTAFTGPGGVNLLSALQGYVVNGNQVTFRFSQQLAGGTYSITIGPNILDSVGNALDQNQDGTPDSYTLTLELQSPDLRVDTVTGPATANFGDVIQISYQVSNLGADPALESWYDAVYLSTDSVLDRDDQLLSFVLPQVLQGPLDAAGGMNDSYSRTVNVQLPLNFASSTGTYYLLVATDYTRRQPESSEANNAAASTALTVSVPPLPDLVVTNITAPVEALSGQEIEVTWTVTNQGTATFSGPLYDQIYLSNNDTIGSDTYFTAISGDVTIPAGGSITRTQRITLPLNLEGLRYVVINTEATNTAFEQAGENNNTTIDNTPIDVRLAPIPNLRVTSVTPPPTAFSSQQTVVEWVVTNVGNGATNASRWYDLVYLSTDDVLDDQDSYLGYAANASYLNAGESYSTSLTVTLPRGFSGPYRFIVVADGYQYVFEHLSENDNSRAGAVTNVELTPPPDLQVTNVNVPAQAFSGQPLNIVWTVTNEGPGQTVETYWYDSYYLSADAVLDGGDIQLGQQWRAGNLDSAEGYTANATVNLPIGVEGDFYIFVRTDLYNQVFEHAYEGNNIGYDATPLHINLTPPPDLVVTSVQAPSTALANHTLAVNYTVANEGATETPNNYWQDRLYLSIDPVFDAGSDLHLGSMTHYGYLDAGAEYNGTFQVTLPQTLSGVYYAFVVTDFGMEVFELDRTNNSGSDTGPLTIDFRPPDLVVNQFSAPAAADAGSSILVNYTVSNVGLGDTVATSWSDQVVLSTDGVLGNGDDVVLATVNRTGLLDSSSSYSGTNVLVTIPLTVATGSYKLFFVTDAGGSVFEHTNEQNNVSAALTLGVTRQTADLQVTSVTFNPTSAQSGDPFTVNWTVQNLGTVATNANYWHDSIYLSLDGDLSGNDILLGSVQRNNALAVNGEYSASRTFTLPVDLQGIYHVLVRTDSESRVIEGDLEGNNVTGSMDQLTATLRPAPDLQVTNVDAPANAYAGQIFNLTWTVQNTGAGNATANWYDAIYVSLDQNLDSGDYYIGYQYRPQGLVAGASYTTTAQFRIPAGLAGPLYVFVRTDAGHAIDERTLENNNTGYDGSALLSTLLPPADLVVGIIEIPVSGVPGQNFTIQYTVENQGSNAAIGNWTDALYLSSDQTWSVNDPLIGRVDVNTSVPGGSSYTRTLNAPAPGVNPGLYYVIIRSDIHNLLPESNEGNNFKATLDSVEFDAEILTLGVEDTGNLSTGGSAYYKITIPAGETVRFELDSISDGANSEVYVRYGSMPSRTTFDFAANEPFLSDQTLTIPAEQAGTYYVLVYRQSSAGGAGYSLEANLVPFSISEVTSTTGGDAGQFTIKIEGAKFQQGTEFELVTPGANGAVFGAVQKVVQDSTAAYVTFDMSFAPQGEYILRARNGINTTTWASPFLIQASIGADVITDIEAANTLRPDRSYTFQLFYANQGNQDSSAPLLLVESASGAPMGLSSGSQVAGVPLQVLGVSPDGPLELLRPGSRGSVFVNFSTGSAAQGVDIQVRRILPTNQEVITDQEWQTIEQSIRPAGHDNATWNTFWSGIRQRIGTTWGQYVGFLNQVLKLVGTTGEPNHDIKGLMNQLILESPNYKPSLVATGVLLDSDTGAPLANTEVAASIEFNGQSFIAAVARTDAQGRYTFYGLQPSTYVLNLLDRNFDIDRDGEADVLPPGFVMSSSTDLDIGAVYVLPYEEPHTTEGAPVIVEDASGVSHVVWSRDGQIWHAVHNGTGWVDAQPISAFEGNDLSLMTAPNLIDGTSPGLIASWTQGVGNESEIVFAVGRMNLEGHYEWSDTLQLTSDLVADYGAKFTLLNDGQVLATFVKQDDAADVVDDGDLYFSLFQVTTAGLVFQNLAADAPISGNTLAPATTGASFSIGWQKSFGPKKIAGIDITASVGLQGGGSIVGCAATASGAITGSLEFDGPSLRSTASGTGTLTAEWAANRKDCVWDFQRATAGWSISGAFDFKRGLFTVLRAVPAGAVIVAGIDGSIAIIEFFTTEEVFQAENGINFTVTAEFADWQWKEEEPFPNFLMPTSIGEASVTLQGGPYLRIKAGDAMIRIDGFLKIKATIAPTFSLSEATGNVQFTGQIGKWTYTDSWSLGYVNSGSLDALGLGLDPASVTTTGGVFSYNPTGALGSGVVHGSNSVLGNVGADLLQDNPMVTVTDASGNVSGAWIKDVDPFGTGIGSEILVSDFVVGSGWTTPTAIPSSVGFNRDLQIGLDAQGRRMAVWSHSSTASLSAATTLAELQASRFVSDVLYSVYDNGAWSTPQAVAETTGYDSKISLATTDDGRIVTAWLTRESDGATSLLATQWNGTSWSTVSEVYTADSIGLPRVAEVGSQLTVFWDQDVNPDPNKNDRSIFFSTFSTTWSAPAQFTPDLSALTLAQLVAAPIPTDASLTTSSILPPVPEECCDCTLKEPPPPPDCGTYQTLDKVKCEYVTHYKPCVVVPRDPNDIVNPAGYGEEHWITADGKIPYMVRFENAADASAPAQSVTITQTLDPDLNPSSFRLGSFGFNNMTFEVPENKAFYNTRLDLVATHGYYVDVVMGIDIVQRQAFWTLTAIDPETGEQPIDANIGFLPVNDATGQGEGFVNYTIRARNTVTTGTRIDAGYVDDDNDFRASIVFDTEGPILTPSVFNTLDADAPESAVMALPASVPSETFEVSWSGNDPNDGSGLALFDIYVSIDGAAFTPWLENTELTHSLYAGEVGRTYAFYSIARDNAGNVEDAPLVADTITATPGGAANIGNFVWHDTDGDGIQDPTEAGLEGVTVNLYLAADNSLLATMETDVNGAYSFPGLELTNQYYLEVIAPSGYGFSPPNQTVDDNLDSDFSIIDGRTATFSVVNGQNFLLDAGLFLLGSISGNVWEDVDGDGTQDLDEEFLEGWRVYLDANDNGVYDAHLNEPSQITDVNGAYTFTGLRPGTYVVAQQVPAGWEQTFPGPAGASGAQTNINALGFQRTYSFSGSTTELSSPGGVEVQQAVSTTDCGCGSSTPSSTGSSTTNASGYHPWADLVQLDAFRSDTLFSGFDGSGSTVVIIDTGIDVDHAFFGPDLDGDGVADRIVYQWDFADRDGDATDRTGHGSHVSSIIGSQDSRYAGIAPGVSIISLKVFSDNGRGYFSYVEQALDWVIQHAAEYNIMAVNLSVGDGQNWNSPLVMHGLGDELATLANMSVATVAAAGNSYGVYESEGLAYPAADPNTIAVGAVWDGDRGGPWSFGSLGTDYTTGADRITSFSQRDADQIDLFAPGAVIGGANATGGVAWLRGTSMATPQVTGAIILGQQIAEAQLGRRLSNFELKSLLQSSGVTIVDGDDENDSVHNTGLTSYRLDVHAFAQAVYAYDGTLVEETNPGGETGTGGTDPGPQNGRPYRFTVTLSAEENRVDVDFGSRIPDDIAPVSTVTALPPYGNATFTVEWAGSDEVDGSGLVGYNVYVSDNGGTYTLWKSLTTDTSAEFTGVDGHTYSFYSRAVDRQNNLEDAPGTPDATIIVDLTAPTSSVSALPTYSSTTISVNWTGSDGTGSGIASYDIYVSENGGAFTLWLDDTIDTTGEYTGLHGSTYAFYSVAADNRGFTEVDTATADTSTLVDAVAPGSSVQALAAISPGTFSVTWTGLDTDSGVLNYDIYISDNGGAFTLWLNDTVATNSNYTGVDGHTYAFYSVATDLAGNTEADPVTADTQTLVDTAAPTSSVQTLPAFSPASFTVQWSGVDGAGAGIAHFDIYVSVNGTAFVIWQDNTTATSAEYTGTDTSTYAFYSIAIDAVGNVEAPPSLYDATTEVDTSAPTSAVLALLGFSPATFAVSWTGSDGLGAGIASYDIYVSVNGGSSTLWLDDTTATTADYTGIDGSTYAFYSIATDLRGLTEAAPVTPDASTTVDILAPTSAVQSLAAFSADVFTVSWSGTDGAGSGIASYDIYVSDNGGEYTLWLNDTTATTNNYSGVNGHTYTFYSVAVDQRGNSEFAPGTPDATTTVDMTPPTSSVGTLPNFSLTSFLVSWTGSDGAGAGIANYDIYVSDNGGSFTLWLENTTATSANYSGVHGHHYAFYSIAVDNRGLIEAVPATPDAVTTVDAAPPHSDVALLPTYSLATFAVNWSGSDATGAGLSSYNIYVSDNGGVFTLWQAATTATTANYTGVNGHTYSFYAVAVDQLGNTEAIPGTPDASTTVDAAAPTSAVTTLSTNSPEVFTLSWSGTDGTGSGLANYDVFVSENGGPWTLLLENTTATSTQFTGVFDRTYAFYSVAADQLGQVEAAPVTADTETTIINQSPAILDDLFSLGENSPNAFALGFVEASDPDPLDTLTFSIVGGNTGGAFAINPTTGEITVANSAVLDFETNPTFTLTVQITDNHGATDTAEVEISLIDFNETPALGDDSFTLAENSATGTAVGTVTGTDPDADDSLTYAILEGNDGGAFAINPLTGEVTVANPAALDFETQPTFSLTVRVLDAGGLSETATITISLTDANDTPQLLLGGGATTYNKKVDKKAPVKVVPDLIVNDADLSEAFRLGGGTLTVSINAVAKVTKKGPKYFDTINGLNSVGSIGTSAGAVYENGVLTQTIQLHAGTTAAQVQSFLRGITFITKGAGLKQATRVLTAQISDNAGATSTVLQQTLNVRKK